ncbi:hypothetical protein [Actinoplanes sp. NPDC026619]|uniref:hypothetical protein n=1 Tax=Actinoplanes sp. NPDC026619 TaxID=3155798 RepID=UPI0033E5C5FC
MDKPDRRPISLAGIGLISAGAVLGLTLATPASAASPADDARPKPAASPIVDKD